MLSQWINPYRFTHNYIANPEDYNREDGDFAYTAAARFILFLALIFSGAYVFYMLVSWNWTGQNFRLGIALTGMVYVFNMIEFVKWFITPFSSTSMRIATYSRDDTVTFLFYVNGVVRKLVAKEIKQANREKAIVYFIDIEMDNTLSVTSDWALAHLRKSKGQPVVHRGVTSSNSLFKLISHLMHVENGQLLTTYFNAKMEGDNLA